MNAYVLKILMQSSDCYEVRGVFPTKTSATHAALEFGPPWAYKIYRFPIGSYASGTLVVDWVNPILAEASKCQTTDPETPT